MNNIGKMFELTCLFYNFSYEFQMEATTSLSEPNPKRQRIMIICGDDDILKQIEKLNDRASSKAIIFDTSKEDIRISAQSSGTVTNELFLFFTRLNKNCFQVDYGTT